MLDFSKKTQTLIGSLICSILIIFTLIKAEGQGVVYAVSDPTSVPNNRFGVHIISASVDEASPAASLVNTNGDWGYITFLIESKNRDPLRWQQFFDDLRRRHLIPIVRLATAPENAHWKRPYEGEEQAWADFLDSLNWPTKNRYVVIYNEPNHAKEWGNQTDPVSYAHVLNKTIDALKNKSPDFFVLNAGFDASTPHQPPNYYDEVAYLAEMNKAIPGIFNKLDGWSSHSYPNGGTGRATINTWFWELQVLRSLGVTKALPVFITETGFRHAEGVKYNSSWPTAEVVAEQYQQAFLGAWNQQRIVAVTPFLLNYQEEPFSHFSFKKFDSNEYYPQFQTLLDLPKNSGRPLQDKKATLTKGEIFSSLVSGESYQISLTFKNTGQSIWNDRNQVRLVPISGGPALGINQVEIPQDIRVEPGQEYTFNLTVKAPNSGNFQVSLNLFEGNTQFDSSPLLFNSEVKAPVILKIKSSLRFAKAEGNYTLSVRGPVNNTNIPVALDSQGSSQEIETRFLLPGYDFEFSLAKSPFGPNTITQRVESGVNTLDFRTLELNLISLIYLTGSYFLSSF